MQVAEIERLKHKPTTNLDAYELLLRAQQLADEFTGESLAAALRRLEQALAIDPTYSVAMALAAYWRAQLVAQGWTRDLETEAKEGLRLASRAIELGKDGEAEATAGAPMAGRTESHAADAAFEHVANAEFTPNLADIDHLPFRILQVQAAQNAGVAPLTMRPFGEQVLNHAPRQDRDRS